MANGRESAFKTLCKIEKDGSYSNILLSESMKSEGLSPRDAALAGWLVKTVLERKITADYNLSLYLGKPLKKLKPQVLTVLRMGLCQLLFTDKIPPSAAINESVSLAKKQGCAFASGLINAVLRRVCEQGLRLPDEEDKLKLLSVKYSFPEELCEIFIKDYGEERAEKIMAASLEPAPVYIRKNSLKDEDLGDNFVQTDFLPDCFIRKTGGDLVRCGEFGKGLFHIQDLSSQICCNILAPKKGDTVLDICASPGGKTATIAELMENSGEITACDIHDHRLKLINDNVKRLGIGIVSVKKRDGTDENTPLPIADRILCDVPCSGYGVTSKKPEIKYKALSESENLPELQLKILENSSRYLKKGGRLVYSTCTLLKRENIGVVNAFLSEHPEFRAVEIDERYRGCREENTLTVLPYAYPCDGFFIALLERIG